jgi:polyhydroxybutyrate depolymerase
VDDVGFVRALIDHLEQQACIDRRRVYAAGMSNGAILSHRLACDAADRIRAIGTVAGTNMAPSCAPARPVPVMHIHGSDDAFVPVGGGLGCGPGGVAYTSVADTVSGWSARDGCTGSAFTRLVEGDVTCTRFGACPAGTDVDLCIVAAGGHQWPGGTPPVVPGIGSCLFGYQTQAFSASHALWEFFAAYPAR